MIDSRSVEGEIRFTDHQVLAIDVFGDWAAVFRFSLWTAGSFETDTELGQRQIDGRWDEITSGGMWGLGWPWTPLHGDWTEGHLLPLCQNGMDVELDDGTDAAVIGLCGFASPSTDAIVVAGDGYQRTITPAATGAYVAVAVGHGFGFVTLTPLQHGKALAPPCSWPNP